MELNLKSAIDVLRRFWSGLSGTNYHGITVPTKFENIQPIPVTLHSQWGADSGDTSPKLYPLCDASGEIQVDDPTLRTAVNTSNIYLSNLDESNASINDGYIGKKSYSQNPAAANLQKLSGIKEITLAGGSASDQELVAALSGYYGVIQLVYVISDTSDTYTLTFQDEDDAALTGLMGGVADVALTADTISKTLEGAVLYKGTDNKALEVDVSGGAGAEKVTIGYLYWYET